MAKQFETGPVWPEERVRPLYAWSRSVTKHGLGRVHIIPAYSDLPLCEVRVWLDGWAWRVPSGRQLCRDCEAASQQSNWWKGTARCA